MNNKPSATLAITSRYYIDTQTKGRLFFESLPEEPTLYWAEGFQDASNKDQAFWYGYDGGTCLIPFRDMRGEKVYKTSKPVSPRKCKWCGNLYAKGFQTNFCGYSCAGNHHSSVNNNEFSDADSGL